LQKITEGGDSKLLANLTLDDDHDIGTSGDEDVDSEMKGVPNNSASGSKGNTAHDAAAKDEIKEQETKGEKKKDKKKKKSNDVEIAKVEVSMPTKESRDAEEKPKKKKKKSKSKSEEGNDAKEQVSATKAEVADIKRKRQDEAGEEPASKKGKKEKKHKGGEQVTQAPNEEIKIAGLEGGSARQDKFLRLLGAKKAGASTAKPGSIAASKNDSVSAEAAIQRQFEAGMQLKESGQRRRGLGA
jgi:hypothetical protein